MKFLKWHILTDEQLAQVQLDAKKPLIDRLQAQLKDIGKANQQVARIVHENTILKAQLDKIILDIKVKAAGGARKVKRAAKRPRKAKQ